MINKHRAALACILVSLAAAGPAAAKIQTLGYWRMGEDDPAAADGKGVVETRDKVGGSNLKASGSPEYAKDISPRAGKTDASKLSIRFAAGDYLSIEGDILPDTDCFGLEAWVKFDGDDLNNNAFIVNNGRGAPGSGYGFIKIGQNLSAIYNGGMIIEDPSRPILIEKNTWVHLALVRDDKSFGTNVYVNGSLAYTTGAKGPAPSSPSAVERPAFTIGGGRAGDGSITGTWVGFIDEVRAFTFKSGSFSADELLCNKKDASVK